MLWARLEINHIVKFSYASPSFNAVTIVTKGFSISRAYFCTFFIKTIYSDKSIDAPSGNKYCIAIPAYSLVLFVWMKLWHLFLSIQWTNKFLLLAAMADEISDLKEGNGGEALEGNVYEEFSIMVARLLIRWL